MPNFNGEEKYKNGIDMFSIIYHYVDFIEDPTRTKPVDPTGKI